MARKIKPEAGFWLLGIDYFLHFYLDTDCWHFANNRVPWHVNILKRQALVEFYEKHADAKTPLETWLAVCKKSEWRNFNELTLAYPDAFPIGDNRVIFDIRGNKYRMVARVLFVYKQIQIKWIGTHGDYDKIDAVTINS